MPVRYIILVQGRVMLWSTDESWSAAMWMIKLMIQQRDHGIVFTGSANREPIAFSDASNKADPSDGYCQYGVCITVNGGAVVAVSKKLRHCSPSGSAAHCEYMALCKANKAVVWIRQLLGELHLDYMVENRTRVYGDNIQANRLCVEDFLSTDSQYIKVLD